MAGHVCSICLSAEASRLAALPCGHVLHLACIIEWLKVNGHCPDCRSSCTEQSVIRLYLQNKTAAENAELMVKQKQLEIDYLRIDLAEQDQVITELEEELRTIRLEAENSKRMAQIIKLVAQGVQDRTKLVSSKKQRARFAATERIMWAGLGDGSAPADPEE